MFQVKKRQSLIPEVTPAHPPLLLPLTVATTPFISGVDASVSMRNTAGSTGSYCRLGRYSCITLCCRDAREREGTRAGNAETNNGKSVRGGKGGSPCLTPTVSVFSLPFFIAHSLSVFPHCCCYSLSWGKFTLVNAGIERAPWIRVDII